jgi:DNA-binding MarR family transcriptional regulator
LYQWAHRAKRSDLPAGTKLVALHLRDFAKMAESADRFANTGRARVWPSTVSIADDLSMASSTVENALRRLQEANLIKIRGRGAGRSYELVLPERRAADDVDDEPRDFLARLF